jgi:hypothetical protein
MNITSHQRVAGSSIERQFENLPSKPNELPATSCVIARFDDTTASDRQSSSIPFSPTRALYALRKGLGYWELIFANSQAILKHEQGIYYVAWLLTHPPAEPIHGLALSLKAAALYDGRTAGAALAVESPNGQKLAIPADACVQERSPALDSSLAAARLRRKQLELEAVLDDEDQPEPVKAEAIRELEDIYKFQKRNPAQIRTAAERAVHSVRTAIIRFHQHAAAATDARGEPHPVLQPFAAHIERHLLIPSGRYSKAAFRKRAGLAGCFTYEPPAGIVWAV